jgi:hypothetical protein
MQTRKKFKESQENTTIENIFHAPMLLGIYATNEPANANEQVQSNVVKSYEFILKCEWTVTQDETQI